MKAHQITTIQAFFQTHNNQFRLTMPTFTNEVLVLNFGWKFGAEQVDSFCLHPGDDSYLSEWFLPIFRKIIEESWLFFNFRFLEYHKILLLELETNNTFLTKIRWVNHSNSKLLDIFREKCFLNDQNLSTESRLLEPKTFSALSKPRASVSLN